jgi:hypothetical protein
VVVHAPVDRVTEVLAAHDHLTQLLDNDWLSLTTVDPTQDHQAFEYEEALSWTPVADRTEATPETETPTAQTVADD